MRVNLWVTYSENMLFGQKPQYLAKIIYRSRNIETFMFLEVDRPEWNLFTYNFIYSLGLIC